MNSVPYFNKWLKVFPNFQTLANANLEDVLKHWKRLDIIQVRNLHKLAIAYDAAENKPTTFDEWIQYPGIGEYTTSAIVSLTFNIPKAVCDSNVVHVITRLEKMIAVSKQQYCYETTAKQSRAHKSN